MRTLDRALQSWRIAKARPFIPQGVRILDVGCADGALFRRLGRLVGEGIGIDPELDEPRAERKYRLLAGTFPADLPDTQPFDIITMLAVLEHIPRNQQQAMANSCTQALAPGGHLIISTPSPIVDHVLRVLKALHLVDGMALEQHYGFRPSEVAPLFAAAGLQLMASQRFQLRLNNLFVFRKAKPEDDGNGRYVTNVAQAGNK